MHLDQLPIKEVLKKDQKPFIKLVENIIEQKKNGEDSSENERKIDEMVYRLYDLTEDEIAIVEQK